MSLLEGKVCTLGFTLPKEQKMSGLGRLLLRQRNFAFEHFWIFLLLVRQRLKAVFLKKKLTAEKSGLPAVANHILRILLIRSSLCILIV